MKRKFITIFTAFITICSLILSSCSATDKIPQKYNPSQFLSESQQSFNIYTHKLFTENVSQNTINMHMLLASPELYGIDKYNITLGSFDIDDMKSASTSICNELKKLNSFDYQSLSDSQKLTYDILNAYYADTLLYSDYYMLDKYLSTNNGQQQLLPLYLSEYTFYSKKDIDDYLNLLICSKDFFESLLAFENAKAQNGLFMNDFEADKIIEQCRDFISDKKNHYLISSFKSRIKDVSGLSKKDQKKYIQLNTNYLNKYLFPSYQLIIDTLEPLKKSGKNPGGLCNYPNGQIYYEKLIRSLTGSDKSVPEIFSMLETSLHNDVSSIQKIYSTNPEIENEISKYKSNSSSVKDIMSYQFNHIKKDFPAAAVSFSDTKIKKVPAVMEKYEAPAYYISPPIDRITDNNIYINHISEQTSDKLNMYSILAHEGFPGHMYQITYFRNSNPDPIRYILGYSGYAEGWAVYSEIYAYGFSGMSTDAVQYEGLFTSMLLELYSLMDIGINYYGWSKDDMKSFCDKWGFDSTTSDILYNSLIESAGNYLQYSVGYLELISLKNNAQNALGDDFNIKEFHKFILDTGPAPFEIINARLNNFISIK